MMICFRLNVETIIIPFRLIPIFLCFNLVQSPNGNGTANYTGSGSVTTKDGSTYTGTTTGTSSYNSSTGYSGNNTTTVNGSNYSTSTQNGSTTVTTPTTSKTFTRRR
jgi:hypothetical protein